MVNPDDFCKKPCHSGLDLESTSRNQEILNQVQDDSIGAQYRRIDYSSQVKMVMQVHDELVFEVEKSKLEEVSSKIKSIMESAVKLSVPLEVNVDSGENWDVAH